MPFASPSLTIAATSPDGSFGAGSLVRTVLERRDLPLALNPWHPDAYTCALTEIDSGRATRVVVIGCGDGRAVDGCLRRCALPIVGVSSQDEVQRAQQSFPARTWLACDLTTPNDLDALPARLGLDGRPVVVLVPGALETTSDPRPLLRMLKQLFLQCPGSHLVLGTVERVRSTGTAGASAPCPGHAREWSRAELVALLSASGFTIVRSSYGRAHEFDNHRSGLILEATLSRAGYDCVLEGFGLPPSGTRHLLLSTEHGKCRLTGGIGSYVEEKLALSQGRLAFGIVTWEENLPPMEVVNSEHWLTPAKLGLKASGRQLAELTLHIVLQAVALLPELSSIEFQDYMGMGARLVQAKAAGLIPRSIELRVVCHGTHVYLERASEQWRNSTALRVFTEEHIAVERADRVTFPTRFLRRLYQETGFELAAERTDFCRYPFDRFTIKASELQVDRADTLIFFGKRTRMKGFPLFVAALKKLLEKPGASARLSRLILLGPSDSTLTAENGYIASLRSRMEVVELSQTRHEALATLRLNGPRSICATPYTADNHPVSVLEVLATGCQLVACELGGIPELIPEAQRDRCLTAPTADDLCELIAAGLLADRDTRRETVTAVYEAVTAEQARINSGVAAELDWPSRAGPTVVVPQAAISVIVPCFNTDLLQVEALIWSLNQQTSSPAKVVFVDDGSEGGYAPRLQRLVSERCLFPYQVVRHAVNRGLPAARNTGLKHVESEYVVNIDSDDIPKNDFLRRYVDALDADPAAAAATSFVDYFMDGEDWRLTAHIEPEGYRPLGEGTIAGQTENCLGHANSAFRTSLLRDLGGWDDSDTSMWEDWQLFLRLQSKGLRIAVVPRSTLLYRCRRDSMVRTQPKFAAQRRLARATTTLSRYEAFRLQAVLRTIHEAEERHQQLQRRYDELQAQHDRLRHRVGRTLAEFVERDPGIYERLRLLNDRVIVTLENARALGRSKESNGAEPLPSMGSTLRLASSALEAVRTRLTRSRDDSKR